MEVVGRCIEALSGNFSLDATLSHWLKVNDGRLSHYEDLTQEEEATEAAFRMWLSTRPSLPTKEFFPEWRQLQTVRRALDAEFGEGVWWNWPEVLVRMKQCDRVASFSDDLDVVDGEANFCRESVLHDG